ncbi:hypothetical protein [Candidatus Tisiphia endosymbiont of Ceraclea dissimilis]
MKTVISGAKKSAIFYRYNRFCHNLLYRIQVILQNEISYNHNV